MSGAFRRFGPESPFDDPFGHMRATARSFLGHTTSGDTPGTLYLNWLFEPNTPDELVEDIYMHTLTLAIFAAIQRPPTARVTWPHDDEIAARVVTAAAPPKGGVQ